MPKPKVKELMRLFKAQFAEEEQVNIPLQLRHEAPDVVFASLLDPEDQPGNTSTMPMEDLFAEGAGMSLEEELAGMLGMGGGMGMMDAGMMGMEEDPMMAGGGPPGAPEAAGAPPMMPPMGPEGF